MTSIGNDIVDLKAIDISRSRSGRYQSKILSVTEQKRYQQPFAGIPSEYLTWLLWSIKESAYKCLQRHKPALVFSPTKIEVNLLRVPAIIPVLPLTHLLEGTGFNAAECFSSEVLFDHQTHYGQSVIYAGELLATVVLPHPDFNDVQWGINEDGETDHAAQSTAVRELLLNRLQSQYPGKALTIAKNASGCPMLMTDGDAVGAPISLSHHGRFVGYAAG